MFGQDNDVLSGALQLGKKFDGLEYLHILSGKNKIADELSKLGSSRAMVPQGSLCRNSMSQALAWASKVVVSSQETTPPVESIPESPEVMEIHSD
jgi:hypothetical protein